MFSPKKPLLFLDFIHANGKKNPLAFKDPKQIISAEKINEVIPALNEVQSAVDNGYYAAGFLTYEAAPAFDRAFHVKENNKMPLVWFGIFDKPVIEAANSSGTFSLSDWKPSTTVEKYNLDIEKIKHYIEKGDTYQVNYTIRMHADFHGDALAFYNQLAKTQSANYSAYLDIEDFTILSASPELFFHIKNEKMVTKPMKGTAARGKTTDEDIQNAKWLHRSEKNRAENIMIVDLLRNDLGIIAKPGTVDVPELFTVEKYPTVYQMTSTVTAEVQPHKTITDIFRALFPCGSITGAPKVSTMNIISELETSPREVYCGAIGYITPDHEAVFNVPIRTVVVDKRDDSAQYGVGGGITWDSTKEGEYDEILTKAQLLKQKRSDFQLLESLLLENGDYFLLDSHIMRLEDSAVYFDFQVEAESVREKLLKFAVGKKDGQWKVRLLASPGGQIQVEGNRITPFNGTQHIGLAREPIDRENIFFYHKTTNREMYQYFKKQYPNAFDVLLWNNREELTEFTMGNVVVELDGVLYTPPIDCGMLPGTYRKQLLASGKIKERKITVDELKGCTQLWFINSVRKWVPVKLIRLSKSR